VSEAPPLKPGLTRAEWVVTLLIASVQFVNILDFVIVMPLGPKFAAALDISEASLGYVNGSYTAAAAVTGLLGSLFLDRFDRRQALGVALFGLVLGTLSGAFATDLPSLLATRVIAGAFGGPATSISFSIIADTIPSRLRGRAMGTVMGAFSVAAVFGVPAGLFLADVFSWRAPFIAVASLGLVVGLSAVFALPPMRGHLAAQQLPKASFAELLNRPTVLQSYTMTAVVMMAGFLLIPNIASYLSLNFGFPQANLKWAYGCGGIASLVATQVGGRLVDRFGSFKVGTVGTFAAIVVVFVTYYLPWTEAPSWAVYASFICFMLSLGFRNVAYNTLASKVPAPDVRARFQSLQSSVQHLGSALAAYASAQILSTQPHHWDDPARVPRVLVGMDRVALLSIGLSLAIPVLIFNVERRVKLQAALKPPA
jgi:predicted MFS family arabinose efflux permease